MFGLLGCMSNKEFTNEGWRQVLMMTEANSFRCTLPGC
jgi:hypothetical protein